MTRIGSVWIGDTKTELYPVVVIKYNVTFGENAMRISIVVKNLCALITVH